MAQKRTPSSDAPGRAQRRSATRRRRNRFLLLAIPVVVVAIAAALILVLGGGDDGVLGGIIGGGEEKEVPPFEFRLTRTDLEATSAGAELEALRPGAEAAALETVPILDELFTNAYLDPENWENGDYEEILDLFSDDAAASAQLPDAIQTLTLGPTAGDVYEDVTPRKGSLRFSVLLDQEGNPDTVAVRVRFFALGARKDGTYTSIVSAGQVFLREIDGWKITAFRMHRGDRETEPPSPSAAPSGSATTSPSS